MTWIDTYVHDATELIHAFRDFWTKVGRIAAPGVVGPKVLKVVPAVEVSGESVRIEIGRNAEPLSVLGVTGQSAPGGTKFDIYITGAQVVRRLAFDDGRTAWITVRAEFDVLYLNAIERSVGRQAWRSRDKVSQPYAGYRITSDVHPHSKVRAHHPDCHARYCLDGIDEDLVERIYKGGDDAWWRNCARHGHPCIPSAPLDLPGIAYMLLHEHVKNGLESGWPAELEEAIMRLPTFKLEHDARSHSLHWYNHSHVKAQGAAPDILTRQPDGFAVPPNAAAAGWSACIAGHESRETPHLTVTRGKDVRLRVNLRAQRLMEEDKKNSIPAELWAEILRTFNDWIALWNEHYGKENPV